MTTVVAEPIAVFAPNFVSFLLTNPTPDVSLLPQCDCVAPWLQGPTIIESEDRDVRTPPGANGKTDERE